MLNLRWKKAFTMVVSFVLLWSFTVLVSADTPDGEISRLGTAGEMILQDGAQLLSESEKQELTEYGSRAAEETGLQIFVRTTNSTDGKEIRLYLADEYEKMGKTDKQPAIMLCVDMGAREAAVVTSQASLSYFPVSKTNEMNDAVLNRLSDGEYAEAVEQFLKDSRDAVINYGVKPVGKIVLISFGTGLLIALIAVGVMVYAHPKVSNSQVSSSRYLKGKVQIYRREDRFLSTHTTHRTIEKNDGGSSSGGSFSSSSGGSYSGSSGKF